MCMNNIEDDNLLVTIVTLEGKMYRSVFSPTENRDKKPRVEGESVNKIFVCERSWWKIEQILLFVEERGKFFGIAGAVTDVPTRK